MRHQEYADARELWRNASGDEWMRRNAEEIDHDITNMQRLGKTRREVDVECLKGVSRDASVLEVGSGYGRGIAEMRTLGFHRLCGLDINLAGLRRSRGAVVQADWTGLPFPDESFDLVHTNGTLMHVHPLIMRRVTDELVRVTRKWLWCFEPVSVKLQPVVYPPELNIPPAYLCDLPAIMATLQPELGLSWGHVWEGPKGQYAMLLYLKGSAVGF